jgi:hypothetical protein
MMNFRGKANCSRDKQGQEHGREGAKGDDRIHEGETERRERGAATLAEGTSPGGKVKGCRTSTHKVHKAD